MAYNNYDFFTGTLKMLNNFNRPNSYKPNFCYDHCHPKLTELCKKYTLKQIAGDGGDLSQALRLLDWLCNNTYYKGESNPDVPYNALDLLNHSFGKGEEGGMNCNAMATTLSECCLAIGLKSRTVYIMPFNPYEMDNHVVTMVFVHDLNKWIMLDPSYNAYMTDENGIILNPLEARQLLAEQSIVKLNKEFNENGDRSGGEEYIEYMAKDLFCFVCAEKSTVNGNFGNDSKMLTLAPIGYDTNKYDVANVEYRIRKTGERENLLKWLAKVKETEPIYISLDDFISS